MSTRKLRSVSRISVRHQVFEELKSQLVSGSWQPGTRIPSESELCKTLGVSRITVREALQRLAALGILETRQGNGTFVRKVSTDSYVRTLLPGLVLDKPELMEVLEYRKIIEPGIAAVAAEKASEDDIAKLHRHYATMLALSDDSRRFADADADFHRTIARSTHNRIMYQINNVIYDILSGFMETIVEMLGTQDGLRYHLRLVEAIQNKNPDQARQVMSEHVTRTIDRIGRLLYP